MAATKLTASGASDGYAALAGDDGSLEIWVGPNGAKILAATFSAAGKLSLPVQSMVRLNTANGYGSTNTAIRRFTTAVTSQGTDITYVDSATLGASFTINAAGVYSISYSDQFNTASSLGITLNTISPSTGVTGVAAAQILAAATSAGPNYGINCSWTGFLPAGSVVRAHASITPSGSNTVLEQFTITRVA